MGRKRRRRRRRRRRHRREERERGGGWWDLTDEGEVSALIEMLIVSIPDLSCSCCLNNIREIFLINCSFFFFFFFFFGGRERGP